VAWNPPEGVDLDEVIEVAEEMGYLPDKSGQEYIDHLRENTDVDVMGTPERVRSFFNPQAEHWTEPMYPALDMPGGPLRKPIDPADEWTRHIAVLVSNLSHVLPEFEDPYKGSGALDFRDLVRLEVYNQILGFKNAPQLRRHLIRSNARQDFPVHEVLGLESIPHQNTIRNAQQERFGPGASEFIARWARRIEMIGVMRGYEFPKVDDKRLSNNGGILKIPVELKRGYAQGALDLLRDDMPITKDEELATWTDYGLHFDFSLHLCDTGNAPEAELENFADDRGLQKGAGIFETAETFRNDIYRVSIDEWEATFDRWTERILDAVFPKTLRSRELPVAVDSTNIPTWAAETSDLPGVVGTEKLKNTHYAYQILSGQAVSDGMPIQLGHDLQLENRPMHEQLSDLLDTIEAHGCNVGILFADADFASGRVANMLKSRGVDFVISYPKHYVKTHTEEWEDNEQTFGVEPGYLINKNKTTPERAEVTLFGEYSSKVGHAGDDAQQQLSEFFDAEAEWVTDRQNQKTLEAYVDRRDGGDIFEAKNRMRWFTFITNLDVSEEEARALREYYHYRWAIESAYGSYKTHFLPGTRSTNLGLRTYLYLFGISAFNAWVASNVKARRQHLEDNERNRPPIRASRFTTLGQQRYRTDEFLAESINFEMD
jgi:hypothetical protein